MGVSETILAKTKKIGFWGFFYLFTPGFYYYFLLLDKTYNNQNEGGFIYVSSSHWRCSATIVFLKISEISHKNTYVGVSF